MKAKAQIIQTTGAELDTSNGLLKSPSKVPASFSKIFLCLTTAKHSYLIFLRRVLSNFSL